MQMPIGSAINALAIVAGGALGALVGTRIPERVTQVLFQALGLAIIAMGVKLAVGYQDVFLLTLSLALGGVSGALIGLQERLEGFAVYVQKRLAARGGGGSGGESEAGGSNFSESFITGSSIVCVGSMAILGPVEEGLSGNYYILITKAFMDGAIALSIASSKGRGVMLAALPLFIYQGALTLLASLLQPWLQGDVLVEFTAVGGVLIAGVGGSMFFPERFKILNLLPAMLWVCVLFPLFQ